MLVLKRKIGQNLVTNSGLRIALVDISFGRVCLRIEGQNTFEIALAESESIRIDGQVSIRIAEIFGPAAKIGIEAPGHIEIMREEILHPEEVAARGTIWAG